MVTSFRSARDAPACISAARPVWSAWFGVKTRAAMAPDRDRSARRAFDVIVIAAIPTALSLASGAIGVWDGSNITRALLAIPLGASAGAIVAAVATKDLR